MSAPLRAWLAPLLLGAAASCGRDAAAPPPPLAPAPERPRRTLAARLARDRAAALAQAAAVAAFGHEEELAAELPAVETANGGKRFVKLGDDWLPKSTARVWLAWNRPAAGRERPLALDVAVEGHPFGVLVDLAAQLAAHGVELLFVVVPTRLELEPELLVPALAAPIAAASPPASPFAGMEGATPRFLAQLADAGVETLDLTPAFVAGRVGADERMRRLYLRGNTHWTPRGAELAAELVAERLRERPWFAPGALRVGADFAVARRVAQVRGDGFGQAEGAPAESLAANEVEWSAPGGASPITADVARGSPIVVLGDSFVTMHKELGSCFVDQLVRFTGWPIDVVAPQGGGVANCREAFARRGDPLAGKRVVVWLLQSPLLEPAPSWKRVALAAK